MVKGKNNRLENECQDYSEHTHECGQKHAPEDNFFPTCIKEGSSTADPNGRSGKPPVEKV